MPQRFITYSRTEPARTILFCVCFLTGLAQLLTLTPWVSTSVGEALSNVIIVVPICAWGVWAAYTNNAKHMAHSAFVVFAMWLWSGLVRLLVAPDPSKLLWVPFLLIAVIMSVVYLYLSYVGRRDDV